MIQKTLPAFVAAGTMTLAVFAGALSAEDTGVVRVYVLAGQSNMEGKAKNSLWDHQATDDSTREIFAHLRNDDQWIERDDVWINYLGRHGKLTLGYGSRDRTGVEFEFGNVLGDRHEDPVLLIKTAWGGHSLYKKFRSPSNPPPEKLLNEDLKRQVDQTTRRNEKRKENNPLPTLDQVRAEYGTSYADMVGEVTRVRENLDSLFPDLKGREFKISGFFWFQGWNDQYNGAETEYADNMKHLINDVRKDFGVPNLPVVIAVMGQNMSNPAKNAMKVIQDAQLSMEKLPEFSGSVRAVPTDVLVDKAAEALYPTWRQNFEKWELTGSDHAYHYLGSAIWMLRIGHECGDAMITLENEAN